MKRNSHATHNVCRCLKALPVIAILFLCSTYLWAKPPYAVIGYCYTTNEASATNLNDGSGPSINWTTSVPWNDMTMVTDAFFVPNTNNTFSNGGAKGSVLISAAHAQGERCNVALGGAGQDGAFATVCDSASNRSAFASAVTALMMQYGYDGVEIDWETTGAASQTNATDMMEAIYSDVKALSNSSVDGNPRTLSFTTNPSYSGIFNMTTLGSYTDWCFFMGYDWYDYPPDVNGPLNGLNPDIAGTIEGMTDGSQWSYPASKMILGCPLYTNDYQAGTEIDTLSILRLGTAGAYNSSYAEQAYTAPDGDTVYVDTAQSYCDKINWALSEGLKGIGMWDVGQALPYTDSAVSEIWNTIGGNASCLNIGPTATPTKTDTPVVSSTWRVVSGGPSHTDCQGNVWAADENYSGGTAATSTNTITGALPCSTDEALYQDQRYGTFDYVFNVPTGSYQVTLKFAETYFTAVGEREFNVAINGTTELTNFDIFKTAGGENKAIDEVYNNIVSSGGAITISFGPASVNNALVSSIQIIPQASSPTATPTKTSTPTFTPTFTLTPTATSTATPIIYSTWRVVSGGSSHTDCQGNVWAADENYSGGTAATSTNTITGALPCSTDEALYQDQRYGTFDYVFNVPTGSYQVTLKFAETYFTAVGEREFNVAINGTTELTNFDIFKTAGGENKAIDEVYNNIVSSGGAITISFGSASVNNAEVQAIQIIPQSSVPTATFTTTATNTATPTFTSTATSTVTPTASNTASATPTLSATWSAPTWTPTITPTFTPTTLGQSTWRVVAGGPSHTDCQGNVWAADENYGGGTAATSTNTITGALPCSTDEALYQDQRYGTFDYVFNVPTGSYQVTLKFAETYFTAAGEREFNVAINGTTELTNFDIFKTAGGENKAIDEVYNNIVSSGGAITISFGPASVNNAEVQAIQIIPQSSVPTLTPTFTPTPIAWRIVAGGPAHTDCQGNVWIADENYSGGTAATSTNTITGALPCSTDEALYQDQRYGSFTYTFPEPAGNYQITLKFAETYWTAAGDREFNVSINGTTELTNFDIFKTTGGMNKAIDEVFNNIALTSAGAVTVSFGPAAVNYAMVDAIEVIGQPETENALVISDALVYSNGNTPTSTPTRSLINLPSTSTPTSAVTPTDTATEISVTQPVIYPNPVISASANIQLPMENAKHVRIRVCTVSMRVVADMTFDQVIGNTLTLPMADKAGVSLANGLYFVMVQVNGERWIDKLLVLR